MSPREHAFSPAIKHYRRDYAAANEPLWRSLQVLRRQEAKHLGSTLPASLPSGGVVEASKLIENMGAGMRWSRSADRAAASFSGIAHGLISNTAFHVQSYVRKVTSHSDANEKPGSSEDWEELYTFPAGPQVGPTYWAQGVIAAANYTRHINDWYWQTWHHVGGWSDRDPPRLSIQEMSEFLEPRVIKNIRILESIGLTHHRYLFDEEDVAFEICKILGLHDGETAVGRYEAWTDAIATARLNEVIRLASQPLKTRAPRRIVVRDIGDN